MSSTQPASASSDATPFRPNLVLWICCLSIMLVGMDVTIVNVALPAIQQDLRAGLSGLQWTVDAYTLVVASLLMISGAMSDRFGRRRVFQVGLVIFTVGSFLCSLAHTTGELIGYRALQGLGASMLNPVALSIIANAFPLPKDRGRAVGVWGAVAGLSLGLGPPLGGLLIHLLGWRSIFWINLPVGVAALILAALFIPESKAACARAFDPVGQVLVFAGLAALVYAVIEGPRAGWGSPTITGLFAAAGAILVAFCLCEARRTEPLVDLRFFRSVPFSTATVLALCSFASFAGFLFLNTLYLQQVRGLAAFQAGLCTLPLAALMVVTAPISGRLVGRHGPRPALVGAGTGFLLGTLLITGLSATTPLPLLLVAYALFGVGLGMVNPAITNSAVAGMPLSQAGVAAAIASTGRQVGAALGVAVAGTVVNASRAHGADFSQATHPIWWLMTGCGGITLLAAWAAGQPWGAPRPLAALTPVAVDRLVR